MAALILEGGSAGTEVALFSRDRLPASPSKDLGGLDTDGRAMRLEIGANGVYLLHLYVDEEPPENVRSWLDEDDTLEYEFASDSGAIAFGGVESVHDGFEPNPAIRSDAEIPSGRYRAVAYHTDYPDERLDEAIEERLGKAGIDKVQRPGRIFIGAVLLIISMIIMGFADTPWYFGGALLVAAAAWLWTRGITRTDEYRALESARRDVERNFPSIVITLTRLDAAT